MVKCFVKQHDDNFMEKDILVKRKLADRVDWQRILKRRFAVRKIDTEHFTGTVTFLAMDEVSESLWLENPIQVCLVDNGFLWTQHFPQGTNYALTTAFDASGQVVQWYIDICKRHGVNEQGIPWYDDLYLDITIFPSGEVEILDADELEEALREGKVSQEDYDLAWHETHRILQEIERGTFPLFKLSEEHRDLFIRS